MLNIFRACSSISCSYCSFPYSCTVKFGQAFSQLPCNCLSDFISASYCTKPYTEYAFCGSIQNKVGVRQPKSKQMHTYLSVSQQLESICISATQHNESHYTSIKCLLGIKGKLQENTMSPLKGPLHLP